MTGITHPSSEAVDTREHASALTPAAVSVAMFALGLGFSLRVLNTWDESWFAQVIARMRAGDVLYRQISYGAGPLPAYATEALTYVTGVDVLAVKLVVTLAFSAMATLAWLIAGQLGLTGRGRLLMLAGLAYVAPPLQEPPYAPLANACLLGALLAVLHARTALTERTRSASSLLAGAAAALAFASKQDVGFYALAAVLITFAFDRRLHSVLLSLGSFGAIVGCTLGLVWSSGGLAGYIDYGFTGKGAYVRASVTFFTGMNSALQALRDVHSPASAEAAYWSLGFFVPCLAVGGLLALLYAARRGARHVLPVAVFAAAGGATLYPRWDSLHVAYAAPIFVILLSYAVHVWRSRLPAPVILAIGAWTAIAIVLMATLPLRLTHSSAANLSTLPHFKGVFVQEADAMRWHREATRLRAAAHGNAALLLLVPDAGFRYLTAGLRNPTAFDFPFVTTFGRHGQQRVVEGLESGRIGPVCIATDWFGLEPTRIVRYVRKTMRVGAQLGFCTLYVPAA